MSLAIAMAERGLLPDPVVRAGIRALLRQRLRAVSGADPAAFLRAMAEHPIAVETAAANAQHYEVPAAFFATILGPRLKYSACLWDDAGPDLARAELAMLDLTIARAGVAGGQRILELGCGWGSLTLRLAERFPDSDIVAVSNSASQRRFIEGRAAAAGLGNVAVRTADVATFEPGSTFDRVVSVEMFEHLRNWPAMLRRVATWLAPEGRLFLHVFCHKDRPYPFETDGDADWMARYFFTGGIMPSFDLPARIDGPLAVETSWAVNGSHYARTLLAWLARLDAARDRVLPILAGVYGAGDATVWLRRWRLFLLACAELFAYRGGEEWFVGHYLMNHRGGRCETR